VKLIGMLDSPYVRRVAISLQLLGLRFEHQSLSVFRTFSEFQQINPVVKAPTLLCDDGEVLMAPSQARACARQVSAWPWHGTSRSKCFPRSCPPQTFSAWLPTRRQLRHSPSSRQRPTVRVRTDMKADFSVESSVARPVIQRNWLSLAREALSFVASKT
jgi:hypothetical protein